MAFSCGFYDAIDNDRTYSATQFGEMFDGLITDGIYATIGDAFAVVPGSGVGVKVKPGRAWFNKTWSVNTADLPLTLADPDLLLSRIDAVILEVDTRVITRNNSIKVITGNPGIDPEKPTPIRADGIYQYPLAWVTVDKNVSVIAASKIENNIGLAPTPFVTGILKSITIDELWTQWEGQFDEWFENVQSQLEGNVALNLQHQIDQLKTNKVNVSDKATTEDIKAGTDNKWVDAKGMSSFVNNALTPSFGETTLTPTRYPMLGQSLSVSGHPELFAKIGYKCGLGGMPHDIVWQWNNLNIDINNGSNSKTKWYAPEMGYRIYGLPSSYQATQTRYFGKSFGRILKSRLGPVYNASSYYPNGYNISFDFNSIYLNRSETRFPNTLALLGETGVYAMLLTWDSTTTSYLRLIKLDPDQDSADTEPIKVAINTASTVMNKLNCNLSPYIYGTTIKWAYLYTLNNLLYVGVITISNYTTTPAYTTATVQIPTSSDTVNWTDASLQTGINRSIILDGKVYIHVINKTGTVVMYVYDLVASSWATVSAAQKNLVAAWTKKYANFWYQNTSYDSFKCMKLGSVKATSDGSLIEYGLIYVDSATKEIKVYEDTTFILEPRDYDAYVLDERVQFSVRSADTSSRKTFYNMFRIKSKKRQYSVYFQFYKGKCAIMVLSDGEVPVGNSIGVSYFDPIDKLQPIQLTHSLWTMSPLNKSTLITSGPSGIIGAYYGYNYDRTYTNAYQISEGIELSRNSQDSSCRFGDENSLALTFLGLLGRTSTQSDDSPVPFTQLVPLYAYMYNSSALDVPTDKFRLLDAHGAPLYYSV